MKGIRPEGKCPKCQGVFKRDSKGYRCPTHLTKPDRYTIAIYFKGKRIRRGTTLEGKTLRTFADAYALLRQAEKEKDAFKFDPKKWKSKTKLEFTFSTLIDTWYQDKEDEEKEGDLAPSYLLTLQSYIKNHYKPFFKEQDVREITSLKPFQKQLSGLSPKYRTNLTDTLMGFFNLLKEENLIEKVPLSKTIVIPEYEPTVLSVEAQQAILELIPIVHKPIFVFLFHQGVRPGEARALKWKDIEGDTVTIRRTWSDSVLRERTKTKSIRHNLLFEETLKALPPRGFGEEFVFLHGVEKRRHYSGDFLNKLFNTAARELGLTVELYEATKHSFGTQKVNEEGVSLELLQKWFGHTKLEMTLKYAKLKVVDAFRQIEKKKKKVVELKTASGDDRQ